MDKSNGYVYSVDKARISFVADSMYVQEIAEWFTWLARTDITIYPPNMGFAKYRNMLTITYGEDTATLGFCWNGTDPREDSRKGFLEFNPNKVGDIEQFQKDYRELKSCCRVWEAARIDLALDIPSPRRSVFLAKDQRVYECKIYSLENMTEYLGIRNQVGRVKVYNKQLEQKLEYPLTRIEVTCEPRVYSYIAAFPKVYDLSRGFQLDFEALQLNSTDRYIIETESILLENRLDNGLERLKDLGRTKREKLEQYILPESSRVIFNVNCLDEVLAHFNAQYIN